jgi:hypothetical protein
VIRDAETAILLDPTERDALGVRILPVGSPPIVLWFARAGYFPEMVDSFLGVEIGDFKDRLSTKAVARIAANLDLFLEYACALLVNDQEGTSKSLTMFQNLGKTKRGMPKEFYEMIAEEYRQREAAGEPHIVKAVAEAHSVTPSAASRWIKAARGHGYLEEVTNA